MLFQRDSGGAAWLIVGLGNPGEKYENTRHNVGFQVIDELAERQGKPVQRLKFKALTGLLTIGGEKALVMKPVTYMNLSGEAVRPAADFYKLPPERILVISDDVALAAGRLRIRAKGSAGGHNGLKSIIQHLEMCIRDRVGAQPVRGAVQPPAPDLPGPPGGGVRPGAPGVLSGPAGPGGTGLIPTILCVPPPSAGNCWMWEHRGEGGKDLILL